MIANKQSLSVVGALDKYITAGKVAQEAIQQIINKCTEGTLVYDIISFGEKFIIEQLSKVYSKQKLQKGLAFPISLNINSVCAYFSPDKDCKVKLQKGDLVKIDFGVHIDNYPVMLTHTIVIGDYTS